MIREELSEMSEAPRVPARKPSPWLPILLVVAVGLGVAHVAGLTKPLKSMALQVSRTVTGKAEAPGSRLLGDWQSDNDPMCESVCFPVIKNAECGTGMFFAHRGGRNGGVIYKIVAEDSAGRNLELAEFLPGVNHNYRAKYAIALDGKSMTREYDAPNGTHIVCQYRYVGPPTETLAQ